MKKKKEDILPLNVLHETANVDKKTVTSGKVIIHKKVHEEEETVAVPVAQEELEIKKVAVNKYVDTVPVARQEGDTMIIPVVKEVVVIEKKLLLIEEVHVTKHILQQTQEQTVPLRREEIEIERFTRNTQ